MKKIFYLLTCISVVLFLLPQCQQCPKEQKAKYVFYFIGDGMGVNQVNATEMYMAEQEGRIGVKPLNFTQFPVQGFATTYSASNGVTCSSAAGTALATGTKTKNGVVAMDSSLQSPLYSVAVKAKKAGKKVGIATSVSVDHATPAVFYAHQPQRSMYYEIATDLPKAGFDLYAGAGFKRPKNLKDSTAADIYSIFQDSAYVVLRGVKEFWEQSPQVSKAILIQEEGKDRSALPYAIDRNADELTLEQITKNAIDYLSRDNQDGFFLMVEGGKIDWACHDNDAATLFLEVIYFSQAIQEAIDFYDQHPDETLIVVTADHETGGIALGTGKYELNLKILQHQKLSKEEMTRKIQELRKEKNNQVSWEEVRALLTENMGFWESVPLTEKQEKRLKEVYQETFRGKDVKMTESLYASNEPLAEEAVKILAEIAKIGWTSGGHSAGVVPVYAIGVGAELFQGKLDNTDIPHKIARAAGYDSDKIH